MINNLRIIISFNRRRAMAQYKILRPTIEFWQQIECYLHSNRTEKKKNVATMLIGA